MRKGHYPRDCKSKNVCTLCKQRHHSLIHREQTTVTNDPPSSPNVATNPLGTTSNGNPEITNVTHGESIASNNSSHQSFKATLLPTAIVMLRSSSVCVRALLDQGSQATFIFASIAQLIKAEREPASITVSGVGGTQAGTMKSSQTVVKLSVEPCSRKGPIIPIKL